MFKIDGRDCWTLFDSGARNSYVVPEVAVGLVRKRLTTPRPTALGGQIQQINESTILEGTLEGYPMDLDAYVLRDIGTDERGRKIEILFGALAMQKWGIQLRPEEEKIDLTHYPKEFIEYCFC